jgi:hypothetical protein
VEKQEKLIGLIKKRYNGDTYGYNISPIQEEKNK